MIEQHHCCSIDWKQERKKIKEYFRIRDTVHMQHAALGMDGWPNFAWALTKRGCHIEISLLDDRGPMCRPICGPEGKGSVSTGKYKSMVRQFPFI